MYDPWGDHIPEAEGSEELREKLGGANTSFKPIQYDELEKAEGVPEDLASRARFLKEKVQEAERTGETNHVDGSCERCHKLTAVTITFLADEEAVKLGAPGSYLLVCAICQLYLLEQAKNASLTQRFDRGKGN